MLQIYFGIRLYQKIQECHTLVLSFPLNLQQPQPSPRRALPLYVKVHLPSLRYTNRRFFSTIFSELHLRVKLLSISFSVVDVICRGFCYQGNKNELVAAKTTVCSQTRWRKDGKLRKTCFLFSKQTLSKSTRGLSNTNVISLLPLLGLANGQKSKIK